MHTPYLNTRQRYRRFSEIIELPHRNRLIMENENNSNAVDLSPWTPYFTSAPDHCSLEAVQ